MSKDVDLDMIVEGVWKACDYESEVRIRLSGKTLLWLRDKLGLDSSLLKKRGIGIFEIWNTPVFRAVLVKDEEIDFMTMRVSPLLSYQDVMQELMDIKRNARRDYDEVMREVRERKERDIDCRSKWGN